MAQAELEQQDHLSDYERAVCYYTLPKVTHPVTYGLIAVYALCLLEALAAIIYGLWFEHELVLRIGAVAFGGLVVFGIVVFTGRAFLSEVRQRRALAEARGVPDALREAEDIPDPFADHLLLKRPVHVSSTLFACTDDDATIEYLVEAAPENGWWKLKTAQDLEVCRVKAVGGVASFMFGQALPRQLNVYQDEKETAQILRRFSFTENVTDILVELPKAAKYQVRGQAVYRENSLVGRIYALRGSCYLDIQKEALHPAVLAYFVTATD